MGGLSRRGFLGSILALGAAPAIVRADSLMRIVPRHAEVYAFQSYSEGLLLTDFWTPELKLEGLVTATYRANKQQLLDTIMVNNTLLRRMQETNAWG